ncbi:hypothetical protein JOF35_008095 [Streptomyces demainii]|uniref:Uncharacterized protein n=1 Tax=Streptomyces demainii TaxID=588122 RepID=A0ABT9L7N4_9ACTN|nr:hypothetical protein [Streptomyces demainii]
MNPADIRGVHPGVRDPAHVARAGHLRSASRATVSACSA